MCLVGRGNQGVAEAQPGRLGEPSRSLGDLADLAGQADLAARHQIGGQGSIHGGRGQGQADGQVGAGLGDADPADRRGVDVDRGEGQAGPALQNRQQEGQAPAVQPLGGPAGQGQPRRDDQGLQFDEQGPVPLHRREDGRAGPTDTPVAEEQPARVGHTAQAAGRSSRTGRARRWPRSGA